MEASLTKLIGEAGGTVVGTVKHPVGMLDFSSAILQAQASKAAVIVLANGAGDASKALKTAQEFGLIQAGQKFMATIFQDTDVRAAGLNIAQGLIYPVPFHRGRSKESEEWSARFYQRMKVMPNYPQAGAYSYTTNYLKAIQAAGTDDATKVVEKMKATPIDDMFAKGRIREDGKFVSDQYLVQVKSPAESKSDWDYTKVLGIVPGDVANPPMAKGDCPFLK
jgi:branched-chain amino acid transport system substrate-binding protein